MQELYESEIEEDHVFVLSSGEQKMVIMNGRGLQGCKLSTHSIFVITIHFICRVKWKMEHSGHRGKQDT